MAMPLHALRDHRAVQQVERREQGGGAVAPVVVRHRPRAAALQRQAGRGAVQRLDLALLVHAQDHGVFRGIAIQTHHVPQLLHELRVAAQLEGAHQVRLQPLRLRHRTHAPVRLSRRFLVQRRFDHRPYLRLRKTRLAMPAGPVPNQPLRPLLGEASAPQQHRRPRNPELRGDRVIGASRRCRQHDPTPEHRPLRRGGRTDPLRQPRLVSPAHPKASCRFPHEPDSIEVWLDCIAISETLH